MKKRNFETKIITGLLTAGMILSLTACGSSSNGSYGISDLMDADYAVASKEVPPQKEFPAPMSREKLFREVLRI